MRRLSSFAFLIGLALFALLLSTVDLGKTWDLLRSADPLWVALSFLFLAPEILLKGLRLRHLAHVFHPKLSFAQASSIYLAGQPLSSITPAKLGDVVRVLGIARWGALRAASAFAVHAADKVYDLMALGLLAAIGLITALSGGGNHPSAVTALLGLGCGMLGMAVFLNPPWMEKVLKPLLLFVAPKKLGEQLRSHGREFYKDLLSLFQPARRAAVPFFYSLAAWGTVFLRAYFCAMALGLPISLGLIALMLPVVIVIEFIPVTILGFGTREAALFLFFASSGVSHAGLVSFSLMMVLAGPLGTALLGIPFAARLGREAGAKP